MSIIGRSITKADLFRFLDSLLESAIGDSNAYHSKLTTYLSISYQIPRETAEVIVSEWVTLNTTHIEYYDNAEPKNNFPDIPEF